MFPRRERRRRGEQLSTLCEHIFMEIRRCNVEQPLQGEEGLKKGLSVPLKCAKARAKIADE